MDDFFYLKATETIIITGSGKDPQIIEGVAIYPAENQIIIKDFKLPNKDIYSVKVEVDDEIEHKNQAGITERYKVLNVDYNKKEDIFQQFPDEIKLKVENLKTKRNDLKPIINLSGIIAGGSITAGGDISAIVSSNINQNIEVIKEYANDPEIALRLTEIEDALKTKNSSKLQTALGFILDKGFDLGLGLIIAKLTGQI